MVWPLLTGAGFVLAVAVVIVLGRTRTARWEQQRAVEDEQVRRRRAQERARSARSAMVAASSVRRRFRHRPHRSGTKGA